MSRTVFIHCGLHKTGTTSIQVALADHRATLRRHGILFPESQHWLAGHHNLAWQVGGDRRFDPLALTIEKLVEQIADFDGDVVLSSEDFETVLHRPHALDPLVGKLKRLGHSIQLVVYTRDRAAYAESLYLELLKHGYSETFDAFEQEAHTTGQVRYLDWVFQFNAYRIRKAITAWQAGVLHERDYDPFAQDKSIVTDFLSVLGLPEQVLGELSSHRHNKRPDLAYLLSCFIRNRIARELSEEETAMIARLIQGSDTNALSPIGRIFSSRTEEAIVRRGGL